MESNPYAPPQANLYAPHQESEAEIIRKDHLVAEGNLQTLGGLLALGSLFGFMATFSLLPEEDHETTSEWLVFAGILALCVVQLIVGLSLRKLKPISRWPATGLTLIGLFGFPIGTLFSLYFLYAINNKRGRFILSPEYQAIRDATPHIKRKTSRVLLIILVVLILLLVIGGLAGFLMSTKTP
jgi:hypothetical protein